MRSVTTSTSRVAKYVLGFLLLNFGTRLAPSYGDRTGLKILASFLIVAFGCLLALRCLAKQIDWLAPSMSKALIVFVLLGSYCAAQRWFIGQPKSQIGLRHFQDWGTEERLYMYLMVPAIAVGMAVGFRTHLSGLIETHGNLGFIVYSVLTGLAWGAVQELLYRGWLQTELTRRFGPALGLFAANLVFTFGPLHVSLFAGQGSSSWVLLTAIFGIGLLFGVAYLRTGNLWIPMVLHGIWPPNMT